jgi:hypothetical protein
VGAARSVSSNPMYSQDEEAENQDKERYRINKNDRLIITSFKLPLEFRMDQKTKQWVAAEGPVSFCNLQNRVCCIPRYIAFARKT